ncbi:MAG: 4'-phosphopantetheinyl transferase superfamily protein [Saprospiraceae bacterium]|nr:4'-phosphopantetheinyl transferase superfamily protein [Saprospiraceae bacterium]
MEVLWVTQSLLQVPADLNWLHSSEKEVLSKFRFEKRRNDWLLGRWTAKQCVKAWLKNIDSGVSLEQMAIVAADDGAPEVIINGHPLNCMISLSHSHQTGLCAISSSTYKIGCDLEKIESRSPQLILDYFTEKEQAIVRQYDQEHTDFLANLIWSAKESVLKALRLGLRLDTRKVEINCTLHEGKGSWHKLEISNSDFDHRFFGCWQRTDEYVMTMVSDQEDFKLLEVGSINF